MYSLFTHKGLKERSPFQITETVKDYINIAQPKIIIISPGYLSTTLYTTGKLLDDILLKWHFQVGDKYLGITAGMNGTDYLGNPINLMNHWNTLKNKNIHIIHFCKSLGSSISYRTNKDHKKMIFFADFLTPGNSLQPSYFLDKNNLDNFINSIKVTAVATGSSNFSKTTYLGNSLYEADKGESDVFMYSKEKKGKNRKFHNHLMKSLRRMNGANSDIPNLNERNIYSSDLNNESVFIPPILSRSLTVGNIPIKASSKISNSLSDDERYLTWMLYATLKDQLS